METGSPVTQTSVGASGTRSLAGSRDGANPGRATDACANAREAHEPPTKRVKLIAAAPAGHEGERRQANAVAAATRRALTQAGFYLEDEISSDPLTINGRHHLGTAKLLRTTCDACVRKLAESKYERIVLILAGSDQKLAPVLGEIPPDDEMITAFTGHELTPDIRKAKYLPGIVALPASSVSDDERAALEGRTTLILTAGPESTARRVADAIVRLIRGAMPDSTNRP